MEHLELKKTVRELAELEDDHNPFISCYINLNDKNWENEVNYQLSKARKTIPQFQLESFDQSVKVINQYLKSKLIDTSEGVAIFCRCGDEHYFNALQFVVPVKTWVGVDYLPSIYHLIEMKDSFHRYVILLTNKNSARILEINLGSVTEAIWTERPETRKRVGREWTKLHYQNHLQDKKNKFFKEKINILNNLINQKGHSHLVLAGHPESMNYLKENLPKNLEEKLVDLVKVSDKSELSTIISKTLNAFIEKEQEESHNLVDELIQSIATNGLATSGEDETMKALYHEQVDLLVIDQDYPDPDIREEMIKQATSIGAKIETVSNNEKLEQIGHVGCFLRYLLPEQMEAS